LVRELHPRKTVWTFFLSELEPALAKLGLYVLAVPFIALAIWFVVQAFDAGYAEYTRFRFAVAAVDVVILLAAIVLRLWDEYEHVSAKSEKGS
jgi:hypothetical protein